MKTAAALTLLFALGCGGSATHKPLSTVPLIHRASADPCPSPSARPAFNCSDPGGGGAPAYCTADSDCVDMPGSTNGRCVGNPHDGCSCSYDTCNSDSDCTTGTICSCGQAWHYGANGPNSCLPSDCHTDTDCGTNGYCSPSLDSTCGAYLGVTSWHCHTPKDTCINDSDCANSDGGYYAPFCGYSSDVGHWSCLTTECAG